MIVPVDEIRVIVLILTLIYASYTDIKTRRVLDRVWIPAIVIGAVLIFYDAYTIGVLETFFRTFLSIFIIGSISYFLFYFRVIYGADYKAFIVIALLMPVNPEFAGFPIYDFSTEITNTDIMDINGIKSFIQIANRQLATNMFGFTVLVNSSVFAVIYFFSNAYRNIVDGVFTIRRPLRSLCARQINSDEVTDHYAQVIEQVEDSNPLIRGIGFIKNGLNGISTDFYKDYLEWHRSRKFTSEDAKISDLDELDLRSFNEESEQWIIDEPKKDREMSEKILDKDKIWITPSIPFIVPMTAGVISSVFLGNIFYIFFLVV